MSKRFARICVMFGLLGLLALAGGGEGLFLPAAQAAGVNPVGKAEGKEKKMIAIERNETKPVAMASGGATGNGGASTGTLAVASTSFMAGQPIPEKYSHLGANTSPVLRWPPAPDGTKSWVLIVEDPDAPTPQPFVHWLVYNLPPDISGLPEGIPANGELNHPAGAMQGKNGGQKTGYMGPHPPKGAPHHYHFQLFALNEMLPLKAGADRDELLKAMSGHVLARGEVVGTFQVK